MHHFFNLENIYLSQNLFNVSASNKRSYVRKRPQLKYDIPHKETTCKEWISNFNEILSCLDSVSYDPINPPKFMQFRLIMSPNHISVSPFSIEFHSIRTYVIVPQHVIFSWEFRDARLSPPPHNWSVSQNQHSKVRRK